MSLYVYRKDSNSWNKNIKELFTDSDKNRVVWFSSNENIQDEFCSCLENETMFEWKGPFLDNPDVKQYLNHYGVRYNGNYMLECDSWLPREMFVTHLNYPLQMACVLLYEYSRSTKKVVGILEKARLFELKYMLPVLEKIDIYVIQDQCDSVWWLNDVVKAGIETFLEDILINDMEPHERCEYLIQWENKYEYLNRQVDAEVFPENYENRLFTPYETSYKEYIMKYATYEITEEDFERDTCELLSDIRVVVNGRNDFDGSYRRYPMHFLYDMQNAWKYISENSSKYPELNDILQEAFFWGKGLIIDCRRESI